MEFPKTYDPKPVETKWYKFWESQGFFHPELPPRSRKKKFSVVIPPPNITGSLHLGHALNNTLQDIIVRYKRMAGFNTLWLPGTDHASISTHNQVEKELKKEGKTRFDLGREKFLERVWEWKQKYGNIIIEQLKSLGCSCDWQYLRFTMDPDLSYAVRETFVRYYEKGLIYRDLYIVNWCPRCRTAISDLEVRYVDVDSHLWYISYPFRDTPGNVVVATTRPETMLGDTAVAVHPKDERHREVVGRTVLLPLAKREIPIIASELVAQDFGTGAVKVTPYHDPVDFEIARNLNLPLLKVIDEDGRMTKEVPLKYQGLTREQARKAVITDLKEEGLLLKVEPYHLRVGTCDRCSTIIEPLASQQWFLKMRPLSEPAIRVVETGKVRFIPERWTKVYLDWMSNIKDWCISRQLWWGHRIPVFYCKDCPEIMVSRTDPTTCSKCGSKNISQDEDILDTWFSSALWPFSTMGWPKQTKELETFFPTDFLSTAPDIIFLWVARMIFSSLEFTGKIPFKEVYIHSIILNEQGERMSRSRGVGIDPLELIAKYGADGLRFTLAYLETKSQSYRLNESKFLIGRNFTNKLWNAARLIYPYLLSLKSESASAEEDMRYEPVDSWIVNRYNQTLKLVTESLESKFNFGQSASELYNFFWHEFCDWYLEFSKSRLQSDSTVKNLLSRLISGILRMLHPFIPFITEELWQRFSFSSKSIMVEEWPKPISLTKRDLESTLLVSQLIDIITGIRNIRAELKIPAKEEVTVYFKTEDRSLMGFLLDSRPFIKKLAKASVIPSLNKTAQKIALTFPNLEVFVLLPQEIDLRDEFKRINEEILELSDRIKAIERHLSDDNFLNKAKPEIIEREQERLRSFQERLRRLKNFME